MAGEFNRIKKKYSYLCGMDINRFYPITPCCQFFLSFKDSFLFEFQDIFLP
jgi:hypothetical protein